MFSLITVATKVAINVLVTIERIIAGEYEQAMLFAGLTVADSAVLWMIYKTLEG